MTHKSYLIGHWSVFKDRGSTEVLGYIVDGTGYPASPGGIPFKISDGDLIDPNGKILGHLTPLGDSWAVSLGKYTIGHVLRVTPA